MSKDRVIRFRVDDPLWDFWEQLPKGQRSTEGRKWFGFWMTTAGEDGIEKWERMLEDHEPYVILARQKKAEYKERERQAVANRDAQQLQRENNLKKLMEGFGRYAYRVQDVPPPVIKNYAEMLGLSVEEIKKMLITEAKKKGMM